MKTMRLKVLLPMVLLAAGAMPALANGLLGSAVTGSLTFSGSPSNYFDPANGFVPSGGYLNTNGATVTVSAGAVEFGFDDGSSLISADFNNGQVTIRDTAEFSGVNNDFQLEFTDSSFLGSTAFFQSGSLMPSDFSVDGNTLLIDYLGGNVTAGQTSTSTLDLSPVPEPPSIVLVLTAIVAGLSIFPIRSLRARLGATTR